MTANALRVTAQQLNGDATRERDLKAPGGILRKGEPGRPMIGDRTLTAAERQRHRCERMRRDKEAAEGEAEAAE